MSGNNIRGTSIFSAGGGSASGVRGSRPAGTTVSILNVDPENEGMAPQSFTVVSSLLQETFWGQNKAEEPTLVGGSSVAGVAAGVVPIGSNETTNSDGSDNHGTNGSSGNDSKNSNGGITSSTGLLPDYNFQEYLNYRPATPPDKNTGDTLLNSFLSGSQGRFPYVDRNLLKKTHEKRFNQPSNLDCPKYRYANFILFTTYAIASVSHTPTQGENPEFEPFGYYSTALRHARMCRSNNPIWQITTLILCAMFQMRTDKDRGCHYDMVRRSMKMCVDIGLHKGQGLDKLESSYEKEFYKRLFWSVYSLERLFAISTGRPFVMGEQEIEIEFPCDINDEDLLDDNKIEEARKYIGEISDPERPTTSMTFIIYIWRLRRLESDLVQAIYRVDRSIEERFSHVDHYLNALREWKESNRVNTPKEQNITITAYSRDIRLLLQPFLGRLSPDSELFQMCVRETGHICQVFRDFYRKKESGFTTMAMHTNFVAGLTLVYCLWLAKDASILPILESVRSCTATLYVLTERSRLCMNYRDTFENLVTTTMKHIIEHRRQRRHRRELEELQIKQQIEEQEKVQQEKLQQQEEQLQRMQQQIILRANSEGGSTPGRSPNNEVLPRALPSLPQPLSLPPVDDSSRRPPLRSNSSSSSIFPVINRSPYLQPSNNTPRPFSPAIVKPEMGEDLNGVPVNKMDSDSALPHSSTTANSTTIPGATEGFPQIQPQQAPPNVVGPALPPPVGQNVVTFGVPGMTTPKDWIEAYGYDDTLYNMIQDISSWTRQVGDANPPSVVGTAGGAVNGPDAAGWFADNMWMNISDFGYS